MTLFDTARPDDCLRRAANAGSIGLLTLSLSACGGGGGDGLGGEMVPFLEGSVSFSQVNPTFLPANVLEITGLDGSARVPTTLLRNTSYDIPGFEAYVRLGDDGSAMLLRQGPFESGFGAHVSASILRGINEPGADFHGGGFYVTPGTRPSEGTATYNGSYAGFLFTGPNAVVNSFISGDVMVTADFGAGTASGRIEDRQRYLTQTGGDASYDFDDLILEEISITNDNKAKFAFTSGGDLDTGNAIPTGGSLRGIWSLSFSGDRALGAGGAVTVTHDYDQPGIGDDYSESGVWIAKR